MIVWVDYYMLVNGKRLGWVWPKNGEACEKVYLLFSENKKIPSFFPSSFETTFAHFLLTALIPHLIKSIHSSVALVCILCPRFKTFEEYLDSLVIEDDQKFLKDVDTARVIAQLGYRLGNSWWFVVTFVCFQVVWKNTFRRGVPAAKRGDCSVKELWQS